MNNTPENDRPHGPAVMSTSAFTTKAPEEQLSTVMVYREMPDGNQNRIAIHEGVLSAHDEFYREDGCLVITGKNGKVIARYRPLSSLSYTIEDKDKEQEHTFAIASCAFSLGTGGDVEHKIDTDLLLITEKMALPADVETRKICDTDSLDFDPDDEVFCQWIMGPHRSIIQHHNDVFGGNWEFEDQDAREWLIHEDGRRSHFVMIADSFSHGYYYQVYYRPKTEGRQSYECTLDEVRLVWDSNMDDMINSFHDTVMLPMKQHLESLALKALSEKKKTVKPSKDQKTTHGE